MSRAPLSPLNEATFSDMVFSDSKSDEAIDPDPRLVPILPAQERELLTSCIGDIASDVLLLSGALHEARICLSFRLPDWNSDREIAEFVVDLLFGCSQILKLCTTAMNNAVKSLESTNHRILGRNPSFRVSLIDKSKTTIMVNRYKEPVNTVELRLHRLVQACRWETDQLCECLNSIRYFTLPSGDVALGMNWYYDLWYHWNVLLYFFNYRCAVAIQELVNHIDKSVYDEVFGIGELANDPIILANTRTPATTARLPVQCIPKRGSTTPYTALSRDEVRYGGPWFTFSRIYETLKTCLYMPWVTYNPFDYQQRHPNPEITVALDQSYDHMSNYYLDYLLKYPVIAKLHRPAHYPCCEVFYPFKHEFQRPLPDIAEQVRRFYNSNTFRKVESLAKRLRERPIYHIVYFRECVHDAIKDVFVIPFAHCLADHLNPLGYAEHDEVWQLHATFASGSVTSLIMVNISLTVRIDDPIPRAIAFNGAINTGVFEPSELPPPLADMSFRLSHFFTPYALKYVDAVSEKLDSHLTLEFEDVHEIEEQ